MPRRIVRTTRRIQYNEDGEPIETVVSSTQERPADQMLSSGEEAEVYEPARGLERTTYVYGDRQPLTTADLTAMQEWARSLRAMTQRQVQALRDLDLRLTHLEDTAFREGNSSSFERSTWWALWGILMLLLGAALFVVFLLIITGIPR